MLGVLALAGSASAQQVIRMPRPPQPQVQINLPDEENAEPELLPDGPNSGRSLEELVAALDSSSLDVRQIADVEVHTRRDIELKQIDVFLDRDDLTPEQRVRLDAAALERFNTSPRAAMGITWNIELPDVASIVGTDERFDARTKLEPGDIFVAIDGVVVNNIDPHSYVRRQIISREPGEMMQLTVLRGKNLLNVELRLGSFNVLRGNGVPPSREDTMAAYRLRAERKGRVTEGPSLGLSKEDWTEACTDSKKRFAVQMQQWRTAGRGTLVAGGAPRMGADDDREQYRRMVARQSGAGPIRGMMNGPRSTVILEDPLERQVASRKLSMSEVIQQTEQTVERLRAIVVNPNADPRRQIGIQPTNIQGQNLRMMGGAPPEVRLAAAERVLEALKSRAAESGEVVEKHEREDSKGRK